LPQLFFIFLKAFFETVDLLLEREVPDFFRALMFATNEFFADFFDVFFADFFGALVAVFFDAFFAVLRDDFLGDFFAGAI